MSRGPDEWLRWQPIWDVYFVLVSAAGLAGVLFTGGAGPARRAGAAGLLVLLVAAHLLIGRRLIHSGRGTRRALAYQLGVVLVFAAAVALAAGSAFMLFALCAPAFMTVGPIAGALVVLALNLVWIGMAAAGETFPGPGSLLAVAGVTATALSIVVGVWACQIIRQSTERATLIRELEDTRAELGRLSYEAGRAAEREQFADAIHDTLAQGLSSTIMLLQATGSALATDAERARRYLELAETTTRDNLADARALITARPLPEATSASLVDALRREVDRLRDMHGIDATLRVDGAPDPADTALNVDLLRLAQEALSNVRKHAEAGRVEVVLSAEAGRVRLEVRDDGRGFAADATPAGHGLPLMRRRLRQAGGALRIDSAPGEGTSVRIQVPA
ncbi:sensor histidine kinase [Microbispora sp. RL4-1S]|uniref:Oxygen sensor histidine kinase NreB n=1 Tax=Microbispora oryzae TaxID=2806554 RepID=A0A940WSD1_9ACTN|nr:sensor histidine kinase [Microbispora oryzae]MBP2708513.1 sensor histidine kinase [Microbispora oryzae]